MLKALEKERKMSKRLFVVANPYTAVEGTDQLSVQQGDLCIGVDTSSLSFWTVRLVISYVKHIFKLQSVFKIQQKKKNL